VKKILLITDSSFVSKNFTDYIKIKNIKEKIIVISSNSISKNIFKKIKKKELSFCIVNFGLSGGIQYNIKNGNEILEKNVEGYLKILNFLKKEKIKNVYFISASCVYPKNLRILREKDFGLSNFEKTSLHYAVSKMIGTYFCLNVNRKSNYSWKSIVPATLYGKYYFNNKNYGHVINAFLEKFKKPKKNLTLWGSGKVKREFLHITDFIDAIFFIKKKKLGNEIINVGTGKDISIKKLAGIFSKIKNFKGRIIWDKTKADGVKKKLLDSKYIFSKGWRPKVDLKEGIKQLIKFYH
jgi:GDP-L-fucose synthase